MSDVKIASELLRDAFLNRFDTAILVSADGDLQPPIDIIKEEFSAKKLVIAFPPDRDNPARALEGKNPLQLDSKAPSVPFKDFAYDEVRFNTLLRSDEKRAEFLMKSAQKSIDERWALYKHMAAMDYSLEEEAA